MTAQERFQTLLRDLFEFDCADLDFGIYRIMNYKRDVIENFISNDLPNIIKKELEQGALAEIARAKEALENAKKKVLETLGEEALDEEGNLAENFHSTTIGKEYLEAQKKATGFLNIEALETNIYNHLYTFFSRYWQDGDFISKRRYSKKERYAIPYNGEEVYLYWANHDQYYIKTGEYFTDYTYKAPNGVIVHFKLRQADVEHNNVKGEKRFFLPRLDEIDWDEAARQVVIPFEYRPLTAQETITYGQKNQQEAIIAKAVTEIPKRLKAADALVALTAERRTTDKGETVTYLEYHLRQYTRRNTSDFFIHKDLKGFLSRELDFYLKNEVLNLEELEAAGEGLSEGWFQLLRLIKGIGLRIIEFLAQIEDFQKMLWEKKKFVTETFYLVTVGNVPEVFYLEIAANDAQWNEWEILFHINEEKTNLFTTGKNKKDCRVTFLKEHPTLVLDTRHFPPDFTDRLLASFEELDEKIDGLLVHSENWQALNVLQEKYRERVKCIYIDPPYNTGNDEFIYKDNYQHSSWLAMMNDRVALMKKFLKIDGTLFSSIDYNEIAALKNLLDMVFQDGFEGLITWRRRHNQPNDRTKMIGLVADYILTCAKDSRALKTSGVGKLDLTGNFSNPDNDPRGPWASKPWKVGAGQSGTRYIIVSPTGRKFEEEWMGDEETYRSLLADNRIIFPREGDGLPRKKYFRHEREEEGQCATNWWEHSYFGHNAGANATMTALFGEKNLINNPKPVELIRGVIQVAGRIVDMVADFFAGSGTTGHAVITLNREDGGRRKFILVEMADYFDTVLVPRIKKVTFTPEWKDGKPKRMATQEEAERSPRIVKVIRLESYEDALNNLTFDEQSSQKALDLFPDDYLLSYMFKWETRQSETLVNVEKLQSPFSYKLHIHHDGESRERTVDLPETFNYLLGLDVQTRCVYDDGGRRYLVYRGALHNGRTVVILWRDITGWKIEDYEREAAFVAEKKLTAGADEIYVNGDSRIPGARSLDPLFKERMFANAEA
ncbi:TPA: site-specific DNA-methyltransferase [Candidatus Poribacteria bacterium]|nr:site-specific DNA-methyltransferase [Candidatus Poribacteria bacterium]